MSDVCDGCGASMIVRIDETRWQTTCWAGLVLSRTRKILFATSRGEVSVRECARVCSRECIGKLGDDLWSKTRVSHSPRPTLELDGEIVEILWSMLVQEKPSEARIIRRFGATP
jgi:hypothetical protein